MNIILLIFIAFACLSAAVLGATINSYVIHRTAMDRRHVESAAIVFGSMALLVLVAWSQGGAV
jgi:hypothetical protein